MVVNPSAVVFNTSVRVASQVFVFASFLVLSALSRPSWTILVTVFGFSLMFRLVLKRCEDTWLLNTCLRT